MPRISAFYGIVISMYFDDHTPSHFHAVYGEFEAKISIADGAIIQGWLPRRARRRVKSWTDLHRLELEENWKRARTGMELANIEPLR